MAYVRPPILTDGDTVDDTYFTILRNDWIAHETHAHTGGTDGAAIASVTVTEVAVLTL